MSSTTTIRAADLIGSMGVDTHIPYTDGGYADIGRVIADLGYLGISNVRDGITDGQSGSASIASYIALAQAGIKFTVVANDSNDPTPDSIAYKISLIDRLNTAVPGSVVAVEGANEINNWPVTFEGQTGLAGALALQRDLYSAVHSDPALTGVAVDYFTGYDAGSVPAGPDPSVTPGLADFDTQHPYPKGGQAPAAWLATAQTLGNEPTPGAFVYTETGYSTNATQSGGVSQDVQARYLLDLYLDAAAVGASRTYVYQLMDAYAPGSAQGDDGYGLFNPDGTPKPAATAIHDLTAILADTGAAAASFTPGALAYSVSGLPSSGHIMAIARSDGTFDIAVWAEPQIWDDTAHGAIPAAPVAATVQLGGSYASVSVYDPLTGTAPIETLSGVSAVQIALTDHPLIIRLGQPAATPTAAAGSAAVAAPAAGTATAPASSQAAAAPGATIPSAAATDPTPAGTGGNSAVQVASTASSSPDIAAPTDQTPAAVSVVVHDDGTSTVDVQGGGQVLAATYYERFLNHGLADNTFVFSPGHGFDVVRGFVVAGADHDGVSLPGQDFASVADVLRNTHRAGSSSVIVDQATGDSVRLVGVTKAQLMHNRADIGLHD